MFEDGRLKKSSSEDGRFKKSGTGGRFTYHEMLSPSSIGTDLLVVATIVTMLALVGPQQAVSIGTRAAFWFTVAAVCYLPNHGLQAWTLYYVGSRATWQIVLWTLVVSGFSALPTAAVLYAAINLFGFAPFKEWSVTTCLLITVPGVTLGSCLGLVMRRNTGHDGVSLAPDSPHPVVTDGTSWQDGAPGTQPPDPARRLGNPAAGATAAGSPEQTSVPAGAGIFLDRLPGRLGRDIICLKAEEHYVHVTTTQGEALVLIRIGDAEADLGSLGMRVHRSHWVAYRHVVRVARTSQRTVIHLSDGSIVPVSRQYWIKVRD